MQARAQVTSRRASSTLLGQDGLGDGGVRQMVAVLGMCGLVATSGLAPAAGQTSRKAAPRPAAASPTATPIAPPIAAAIAPPKPPAGTSPEPIGDPASWLPLEEYPPEARAAVEQRRTVFALLIDDRGRILQCNIVESSGSALRDSATCGLLISNGQFKPARDPAGRAVAGTWQSGIRFNVQEAPAAAE